MLTVHHWSNLATGLAELRRAARQRVVIVTRDPAAREAFWLTTHYVPEIVELDLRSGRWHARFGASARAESADLGYRLVISRKGSLRKGSLP